MVFDFVCNMGNISNDNINNEKSDCIMNDQSNVIWQENDWVDNYEMVIQMCDILMNVPLDGLNHLE